MINLDIFEEANLTTVEGQYRIDNDGYPVKDWTFEEFVNIAAAIKDFDLGTPADAMSPLMDATVLSCIASYAQGMELLRIASQDLDYELHMPSIAQIWKGGCIIRARLLRRIQDAFNADPQLPNLMVDPWFAEQINRRLPGLAQVVAGAAEAGIPVPCFSSTLDYINSYRSGRLPQNLVQAMRDCFGSHTYQRVDKEGTFHTEWLS